MNKIKEYYLLATKSNNTGKNYYLVLIIFRLLIWKLKYKGGFLHFFLLNLHKKGISFKEIVSHKEYQQNHRKLNPVYYRSLLEDKYIFDRFMKSYNYPLAEMKGLFMNEKIFWIDEKRSEPLDSILQYELNCYCKMHIKWGGQNVHKILVNNGIITIDDEVSNIENLKKLVSGTIFVLQTTVIQHPEMNRINNSCVNTIRAITIHNGVFANNYINYLRLGIKNSIVDNITHGGIGCGIHKDGRLFEVALNKYGFSLTHHPDSHIEFKSFKIPHFQSAIDLAVNMHQQLPYFFMIGWDIAITESGPVIIEANPVGDLLYEQAIFGGLRRQYLEYANSYKEKRASKFDY